MVRLSVVLNIVLLIGIILNAIRLSHYVFLMSVIILIAITLSVTILSVIMLNGITLCNYTECR